MKSIEKCDKIINDKGYLYNLFKISSDAFFMQLFYQTNHPNNRIEINEDDLKSIFNKAIHLLENKK